MDKNSTGAGIETRFSIPPNVDTTFRTGPAIHPKELARPSITIKGTLSAPFDFLVRKPQFTSKPDTAHLLIDNQKGVLVLNLEDEDPFTSHTITGTLLDFADLALFRINSNQFWNVRELRKFLRTVRVYFPEGNELDALLESLSKWEASIETVIKNHNDNSGNSLTMLEQKVNGVQLKRSFNLAIPIYKGYGPVKFKVEIGLEPKNTSVELYLISDDLYTLQATKRQEIMSSELAKFDNFHCSKVVIS